MISTSALYVRPGGQIPPTPRPGITYLPVPLHADIPGGLGPADRRADPGPRDDNHPPPAAAPVGDSVRARERTCATSRLPSPRSTQPVAWRRSTSSASTRPAHTGETDTAHVGGWCSRGGACVFREAICEWVKKRWCWLSSVRGGGAGRWGWWGVSKGEAQVGGGFTDKGCVGGRGWQ